MDLRISPPKDLIFCFLPSELFTRILLLFTPADIQYIIDNGIFKEYHQVLQRRVFWEWKAKRELGSPLFREGFLEEQTETDCLSSSHVNTIGTNPSDQHGIPSGKNSLYLEAYIDALRDEKVRYVYKGIEKYIHIHTCMLRTIYRIVDYTIASKVESNVSVTPLDILYQDPLYVHFKNQDKDSTPYENEYIITLIARGLIHLAIDVMSSWGISKAHIDILMIWGAATGGDMELFNKHKDSLRDVNLREQIAYRAALHGHLDILDYVIQNYGLVNIGDCISAAAIGGYEEIILYFAKIPLSEGELASCNNAPSCTLVCDELASLHEVPSEEYMYYSLGNKIYSGSEYTRVPVLEACIHKHRFKIADKLLRVYTNNHTFSHSGMIILHPTRESCMRTYLTTILEDDEGHFDIWVYRYCISRGVPVDNAIRIYNRCDNSTDRRKKIWNFLQTCGVSYGIEL